MYVCHDSFSCAIWLFQLCDMQRKTQECIASLRVYCIVDTCAHMYSFSCAIWLFHTCDMTPSNVRHDSYLQHNTVALCGARLTDSFASLIHVCHDPLICATWLIDMCNMTHSNVRYDYVQHMRCARLTNVQQLGYMWCHNSCVTWLSHICDMTHRNVRRDYIQQMRGARLDNV